MCKASGGDGGVCPSKRWYEAVRALLSGGGLLYKTDLTSSEEVILTLTLLFYGSVLLGLACICHVPYGTL